MTGQTAPYAVSAAECGGRCHPEPEDPLRDPFERDRHRVIASTAFRRLERKTQVFTTTYHDHFRTRLTHTLEVAQVARTLARGLRANETLAEVISLAHDLGHPPFGHAGEAALDEAMAEEGGFNHNTHSLRVVDYLEHPYPQFRGLNLTHETRRGLALHETRYDRPDTQEGGFEDIPGGPGVEAQVASLADRVAVLCADLEDAIGAGLVVGEQLAHVDLWARGMRHARASIPTGGSIHAVRRPILDAMLDVIVDDAVQTSLPELSGYESAAEVRGAATAVSLSREMDETVVQLEHFLLTRIYTSPEIDRMDTEGRAKVLALFEAYCANPVLMPARYVGRIEAQGVARVACDYIAGMTDAYCERQLKEAGIAGC